MPNVALFEINDRYGVAVNQDIPAGGSGFDVFDASQLSSPWATMSQQPSNCVN
jgi:hypothetical protein